jgi:hypothetical protein
MKTADRPGFNGGRLVILAKLAFYAQLLKAFFIPGFREPTP